MTSVKTYVHPERASNASELIALGRKNHQRYAGGTPFPHIILDNLFRAEYLDKLLRAYPPPQSEVWNYRREDEHEVKLGSDLEAMWPDEIVELTRFLNSGVFLKFLSKLTGIAHLIPDPYYEGGGLHQIVKGGRLEVHADFNKHKYTGLDRRLNLLLYLNKDWKDAYKGHLQLWDKAMKKCEKKISPLFNRTVIFTTTDYAYHGHPEFLKCPKGMTRKSIALYYYSNGRPKEEVNPELGKHSTLWQQSKQSGNKARIWLLKIKQFALLFVPPVYHRIKAALFKRN